MKQKCLILFILIIICISNTACTDDFNPYNSAPALPVIYGLYHLDEGRCEIYHSSTYNTIPKFTTEAYFVLEGLQSGYPVWSTPFISYKQNIYSPKEDQANREGLVVEIDKDLHVAYSTIMFDGKHVGQYKANIPGWVPTTQKQYNLYLKFKRKQKMFESFIQNPRFPSVEQIKRFVGL